MYIKKILLNNYRIYYQQSLVEFDKIKEKNISIISGYNGFGKTTFLTSLVWCIYGKHMQDVQPYFKDKILKKGGYKNYLESSINHKSLASGEKEFFVELTFCDVSIPGLGCDEVVIRRSYKLEDKNDRLEIFIDNQQNELVNEIGNELFVQDFLLPKEIAKFFFFDAERITSIAEMSTIEDKRNLSKAYTEVLGIKKYEELKDNLLKIKLKYAKSSASKSDKQALLDYEKSITTLRKQLSDLYGCTEENNEEKESLKQKSDDIQIKLIREGSDLSIIEIEQLRIRKKELTIRYKEIKASYNELLNILPFSLNINLLKEIENQSKNESNEKIKATIKGITGIKKLLLSKKRGAEKLELFDNTPEENKKELINLLESEIDKLKKKTQTNNIIHNFNKIECLKLTALINNIETNYQNRVKDINRQLKINNSERYKVMRQLSNAETKNKDKLIESYREDKKEYDDRIKELININLETAQQIGSLINQINAKESSLKELSKKVKISTNYIKKDKLTTRLIVELDDFILKIKNKKKTTLEKRILESLNLLMHKNDFVDKVIVDVSDEIIDINLYDSRDKLMDKDEFSEGEKQLYATSLLKALVEESNIQFPIFVDSPLQKFDEKHTENVILEFYPSISKQVVIFPLLNKELSEKEYLKIKNKVANTFIINNKDKDSSDLIRVKPEELFILNTMFNKKELSHV